MFRSTKITAAGVLAAALCTSPLASADSFQDPYFDANCESWTAGVTAWLRKRYEGAAHITIDAGDGREPTIIDIPLAGNGLNAELFDLVESGGWSPALVGTNTVSVRFVLDNPTFTGPYDITLEETLTCTANVDIRKQAEGPDSRTVPFGSDVDFDIVVTNLGDQTLTNVAVTDPLAPGCELVFDDLAPGESEAATCTVLGAMSDFTNEACVAASVGDTTVTDCDTSSVVVEQMETGDDFAGCTPGYWKQPHHQDDWMGFSATDDYEQTFGVDANFSATLLYALRQGGGSEKALGRHAVAALLNSSNVDVNYTLSTQDIIDVVQGAYATGDFISAKDVLETENQLGCPLSNGGNHDRKKLFKKAWRQLLRDHDERYTPEAVVRDQKKMKRHHKHNRHCGHRSKAK